MARNEDVTIRLRVDDSELRNRGKGGLRPGVPLTDQSVSSTLALGAAAGVAGSIHNQTLVPATSTAALGSDVSAEGAAGGAARLNERMSVIDKAAIGITDPDLNLFDIHRAARDGTMSQTEVHRRLNRRDSVLGGLKQLRIENDGDLDRGRIESDRRHLRNRAGIIAKMPLPGQELKGSSWYQSVALRNQYNSFKSEGIFAPTTTVKTFHAGAKGPAKKDPWYTSFKPIGASARELGKTGRAAATKVNSFFSADRGGTGGASQILGGLGKIGFAAGGLEMASFAKSVQVARENYARDVFAGKRELDGFFAESFTKGVNDRGKAIVQMTFDAFFSTPAFVLSAINTMLGDYGSEYMDIALDSVGFNIKDALGLNRDYHAKQQAAQVAWYNSRAKLQAKLEQEAEKQADQEAERLWIAGARGVSLNDMRTSIRKDLHRTAVGEHMKKHDIENPMPVDRQSTKAKLDERDVELSYMGMDSGWSMG